MCSRSGVALLEVFAVSHPEPTQGFADTGYTRRRMSFLDQEGPYFNVRGGPALPEPSGVLLESVAVQELLNGLCDVVFQFSRSASVATRPGRPPPPQWAPQASRRALQAPRAPACCGCFALSRCRGIRAGPL